MKYFTLDLLDNLSDTTDEECQIKDKLWMDNLKAYWNQFKNYENRLPARFVKEYCRHAFHDYNINSINYYNDGTKRRDSNNVELVVSYDDNKFLIKYIGVTRYSVNANNINYNRECTFLYSEILPIDNQKMSHEIIIEDRNTVYIEFRKIMFKRLQAE